CGTAPSLQRTEPRAWRGEYERARHLETCLASGTATRAACRPSLPNVVGAQLRGALGRLVCCSSLVGGDPSLPRAEPAKEIFLSPNVATSSSSPPSAAT